MATITNGEHLTAAPFQLQHCLTLSRHLSTFLGSPDLMSFHLLLLFVFSFLFSLSSCCCCCLNIFLEIFLCFSRAATRVSFVLCALLLALCLLILCRYFSATFKQQALVAQVIVSCRYNVKRCHFFVSFLSLFCFFLSFHF